MIEAPGGEVARSVLPSGVRVVTEAMPEALSVTTGLWVTIGGRDEPSELAGTSHFLEHLLFKGTEERSARAIAEAVERVGGEMNAFTSHEHTGYYTRLPAGDMALGLDVLCDVVVAPALRPGDVESERQVILEELHMNEDLPEDVVATRLAAAVFPGHPLGRDVLGTAGTIEAITRDDIAGFHDAHYGPANLVVAAAGRLDHDSVVGRVEAAFRAPSGVRRPDRHDPVDAPLGRVVVPRQSEQVHLAIGWRALHRDHPDRYALLVANHLLGGSPASRLFQSVREDRALAYTVYSSIALFDGAGMLTVYAGSSPQRAGEVEDVIGAEIASLVADGPTPTEFDVAKGALAGGMLLSLEDSAGRMGRIARDELNRGEVVPLAEHMAALEAVTADEVRRVVVDVLAAEPSVAICGPVAG